MVTADELAPQHNKQAWSVELFAAFWTNPKPEFVYSVLTDDVVGHWVGLDDPVQGPDDYVACIAALVSALPDVRLEVAEHATAGEFTFVRWILQATGRKGPFQTNGVDRVRLRDGLVAENVVISDAKAFEGRAGMALPWTS